MILGLYWITKNHETLAGAVRSHPGTMVIALLCSVGFILARGLTLWHAALSTRVSLHPIEAIRGFSEGVAIETFTWPGKLWADGYRWGLPQNAPAQARTRMLIRFRLSIVTACLILIALAGALHTGMSQSFWVASILIISVIVLSRRPKRHTENTARRNWIGTIGLAGAGTLCDLTCISSLAWAMTGVDPILFAASFTALVMLGSVSGMPQGIGVVDGGGWLVLIHQFDVDPTIAASVMMTYRCLGPMLTLAIGAASLICRVTLNSNTNRLRPLIEKTRHASDQYRRRHAQNKPLSNKPLDPLGAC